METYKTLDLQLFAEGGEAADAGGEAADAGQNEALLKLGVPAEKLRRRQPGRGESLPQGAVSTVPPSGDTGRLSWDELMADPEYNRKMQGIVQERVKKSREAEEALGALTPSLGLLARQYGLDPDKGDYGALASAIAGDSRFSADATAADPEAAERQRVRSHVAQLQQQGSELKKQYSDFDLAAELRNPLFARLTAPDMGVSVEDAYFALHHRELQNTALQVTAQKTAEKLASAVAAGNMRPQEALAGAQAPTAISFDYSKATPDQREALKKRIRDAAARGQKIYPGGVRTTHVRTTL